LNQQFTYKNFDLSIFVNFQYGNKVLNANKLEFTSGYTPNSNMLSVMNGRWRNVDDNGNVVTDPEALTTLNANATIWSPMTTNSSFFVHSWAVEDASFIRINNITLGYNVPTAILNKVRITKLRFYGTVNNLAVFTNYSGYDPDVNVRRGSPLTPGVDYSAYPRSRAYIFGLNLSF
jgi:TonB-dependent starch-binding outer membrane protein SusC